ncbi:hypothetical protein KFE25_003002 [Diacronema lutheri]|uniref:Uncharacterized protein n=1 Tax=Diacronema lutheri TaxID=2081491 RepID=A0A8J6CDC3_DIALT|nr:hypothetical protein KFE25_003002 [Diacronema lutheri]
MRVAAGVLLAIVSRPATGAEDRRGRETRTRREESVRFEPAWPEIKRRYVTPFVTSALDDVRRSRDLVSVVAIRSIDSARQRLSGGWLPHGAGESARLAGRSAREAVHVAFWGPTSRRFFFAPLGLACCATSASLLLGASALRALELAARAAVSVTTDLAQQAALFAQFANAVAAGRIAEPVRLPSLPPPRVPTADGAGPEGGTGSTAGADRPVPVVDPPDGRPVLDPQLHATAVGEVHLNGQGVEGGPVGEADDAFERAVRATDGERDDERAADAKAVMREPSPAAVALAGRARGPRILRGWRPRLSRV